MNATLQDEVKGLPKLPGVYLMKGAKGETLYVGKASDLRARVRSYFSKEAESRYQIKFLMSKVRDIETVVTDNSKEALLLESTLIKKHRPRYNIELKDDRSYVSLKLSIKDPAPRLYVTRRIKKDGNLYYGPYTSAGACREVVDFIQRHFRLRTCSDHDYRNRSRPCLQYQIKRCDAPCVGFIAIEDYKKLIERVRLFLEGRNDELKRVVKQEMERASTEERFEDAAAFRDLLHDIDVTLERQKMISHRGADRDVIALYREGQSVLLYLIMVRQGNMQDSRTFFFKSYEEDGELLASFLTQYYGEGREIPEEILLPLALEDQAALGEIMTERAAHPVKVLCPQRGEKYSLLQLARQNAEVAFARRGQKEQDWEKTLTELQQHLKLKNHPHRIECYDISNFQGQASMGSMVTFLNGEAEPKLYRHFKIKTVTGSDDFASLYEVLYRRIRKSREAGGEVGDSPWALPDLVVIDGGKGQLHAVHQAFKDLGVEGVDLISLAKSRLQATDSPVKQRSEERVFLLGRKDPVFFPKNSSILFLLVRLRDEAHRFGIESHRKYLKRSALYSALDAVEGVGKVRRQRLLKNFGSLKGIKAAATDAVARVIGASEDMAKRIQESL